MKNTKRILALLTAVLLLAVSAAPALALSSNYTPIHGQIYEIIERVYLESRNTSIPEIKYKLEFDGPVPYNSEDGNGKHTSGLTYSGVPVFTKDTVDFTTSSTDADKRPVYLNGYYKSYVESKFKVDFSNVQFYEPGVYRWDVTKTALTPNDTTYTGSNPTNHQEKGHLILYVTDASLGADNWKLDFVGDTGNRRELIYKASDEKVSGASIGKNYYDAYKATLTSLSLMKQVKGNMGSRTEYFKFDIQLRHGVQNSKHIIDTTMEEVTRKTPYNDDEHNNVEKLGLQTGYKIKANATDSEYTEGETHYRIVTGTESDLTEEEKRQLVDENKVYYITLDNDGNYPSIENGVQGVKSVWLRHGQEVTIHGYTEGMEYTFKEDKQANQQRYRTDIVRTAGSAVTEFPNTTTRTAARDASIVEDVDITFVNTDDGTTPTGVILETAAPLFGMLMAAVLLAVVLYGKRRRSM